MRLHGNTRSLPIFIPLALVAVLSAAARPAHALQQPNGTTIPTQMGCNSNHPTGLAAVFACACTTAGVCNIGAVCPAPGQCDNGQHGTCETTLAHVFNDNTCIPSTVTGLDPVGEASTDPETFRPTCALTFTVVSRGTALFHDAFGWYNVTGSAPTPADLHTMLDCNTTTGSTAVLDIQNDAAYAGGDVAFFLITPEAGTSKACAGGNCCAAVSRLAAGEGHVYYSQRSFNPDAMGASSYIHLLVYDSHIADAKFYFAWEDIFGGSNNDFTDLVTSVEGVECSGGGAACDTGMPGACAMGVSACTGANLDCQPLVSPGTETCNGVDDDCDGHIDDGATCPDPGDVCVNGRCLGNCSTTHEFDCPADLHCDSTTGRCVDPDCVGVVCPDDTVCRSGLCVGACDGIVCPHGSVCVNGGCVARCDGVSCPDGQVCREGLCMSGCNQCGGVVCGGGDQCELGSGECVNPSCPGGCAPGSYCNAGQCVDECVGATCPPGQTCEGGRCGYPGTFPDAGPSGGGPDAAGGNGEDGGPKFNACGCRAGGRDGGAGGAMWVLVVAGVALALRRGRSRRARTR